MEGKQEDFRNLGPQKGLVVVQNEVFYITFKILPFTMNLALIWEIPNETTLSIPMNSKIHFK